MQDEERIRWAPKVRQAAIWQLYQKDALGIVDDELVDEVGMALYARCRSVLLVSRAQLECPRCGRVVEVGWERGRCEDTPITCSAPRCGWQTTFRQYHNSWRRQDLIGARAEGAFRTFVERYPHASSARERMLLIDQLIHAFHQGIIADAGHRSIANNLIEGSHDQVVAFLDRLAYGEGSAPEAVERHAQWRREMQKMMRSRKQG